ncbi:Crp/Fnr family transcriptional regulator [Seohaeicola zhoushanensis]|uniref:Crp/Fnr family transcriptional regulator n=1 Tax=Seohaeicola zhoushanensis TaxID=1569283 RepID=A0A8J3H024_9RHOB|nr:Crp/Fnr family transcriptional regulator [Seohaeicola zhoushanensis]GHF57310.1 Crp/Fnr family transcriptional regulator [Seohaeicola zhoushanensis]
MAKLDESLLAGLPPFSRLSRPQIREILDLAMPRRFEEGTTVFHDGDPAERFFLLLDGIIRVVRTTPDGAQVIPLHIPAGQLFGIAPAFGRDTYPATAVAAAEIVALSWPSHCWGGFVSRYDGFATETWKTIGERMGELHARIADLATKAVEQRVASALLHLANQSGTRVGNAIEIGFPITRAEVAEMTGTTLHTVSRLLSAWEKDGIVSSARKQITVTEPHRLFLLSGAS